MLPGLFVVKLVSEMLCKTFSCLRKMNQILDLSPVLSSNISRWIIKSNLNSPGQSWG